MRSPTLHYKNSEKYVVGNFRLERNVPMSEVYLAKLDDTMRALSAQLNVSAEVVVVAGHELLWHSKTDYPKARTELSELVHHESAATRLQPKYHALPIRGG